MTLLTHEVQAMVGRTVSFTAPEPLGRAAIRYFAVAVGDDNPLYVDAETARRYGHADVIAPPTLVCETNQYMTGTRDEVGYLGFVWDIPVPEGALLVRGGNDYEFARSVTPDDVITATFTLTDIRERLASQGSMMLIVTNEIVYTDQHGERLATNRETLIWRCPT